jgi:hypothetical protein
MAVRSDHIGAVFFHRSKATPLRTCYLTLKRS